MTKPAVMLCGHGSRDASAIREFDSVASLMRERLHGHDVEHGYLEFARPIIAEGLDKLRARGSKQILAVPCMLFAAGHAKNDIPSVLNTYMARHPGVAIRYGRDLGIDAKLLAASGSRVLEAEAAANRAHGALPRHDCLLMVVGRGTSDSDANSNISKVTRMLWEGLGFGWAETAYSGVTFPLVDPGLEHAARLGYKRIIVFPYFLFTGILVQRIYDATDDVAKRHPGVEFIKAPYLNDHPAVIDTFVERVQQILTGDIAMNCQMCKYRTAVLGFEADVGAVQESHHHHVEGINAKGPFEIVNHAHSHDHEHGHDHSHDDGHTHAPYPHAKHPLGPVSMKKK